MLMSASDSLRDAVVGRLAAQWIALGVTLVGSPEKALVDLEALIAMTAALGDHDPRVHEGALDWCIAYGEAVNAGRLRTVATEMGVDPARLGAFAALAAAAGGPRWPIEGTAPYRYVPRGKVQVRDLRDPAVLAWRLRSAMGVNARADIVAILAATGDRQVTLADLARLVRFTKRNVAFAVRSLALAGVLEVDRVANEQRVRLTRHAGLRAWIGDVPAPYVDWLARFAVALRVLGFAVPPSASPRVRAIEAQALVAGLAPLVRRSGLPELEPTPVDEAFNDAFERWLIDLAAVFSP